jgi:hypothetical protein
VLDGYEVVFIASPEENARRIKEFLAGPLRPTAFDRLRAALLNIT